MKTIFLLLSLFVSLAHAQGDKLNFKISYWKDMDRYSTAEDKVFIGDNLLPTLHGKFILELKDAIQKDQALNQQLDLLLNVTRVPLLINVYAQDDYSTIPGLLVVSTYESLSKEKRNMFEKNYSALRVTDYKEIIAKIIEDIKARIRRADVINESYEQLQDFGLLSAEPTCDV